MCVWCHLMRKLNCLSHQKILWFPLLQNKGGKDEKPEGIRKTADMQKISC